MARSPVGHRWDTAVYIRGTLITTETVALDVAASSMRMKIEAAIRAIAWLTKQAM